MDPISLRTKQAALASAGVARRAFNAREAAALLGVSLNTWQLAAVTAGVNGRRISPRVIIFTDKDIDDVLNALPKVDPTAV